MPLGFFLVYKLHKSNESVYQLDIFLISTKTYVVDTH